jgi:hypothetical protein
MTEFCAQNAGNVLQFPVSNFKNRVITGQSTLYTAKEYVQFLDIAQWDSISVTER